MISKPIMDISVPEKEKVTFECEVSRTNADVKWFKVRNYSSNCCLQSKMTLKNCTEHV